MAVLTERDMALLVLESLVQQIKDGNATIEGCDLSVESFDGGMQDGWTLNKTTRRRFLSVTYQVPESSRDAKESE